MYRILHHAIEAFFSICGPPLVGIASIKSGQITEERISEIAGLYFPVAAVQAGILDISAENKAEFIRGVLEGYFPVQ